MNGDRKFGQKSIEEIRGNIFGNYLENYATGGNQELYSPSFSYNGSKTDLFGLLDVFLSIYILDKEGKFRDKMDLSDWFDRILSFQDSEFYFMPGEYTFHVKEHASAYAISILKLLALQDDTCQKKFESLKVPEVYLRLILEEKRFFKWFNRMGLKWPSFDFRKGIKHNLRANSKHLGWHNIWPSSHIGGGIPAYISMTKSIIANRYNVEERAINRFFDNYFNRLDKICDGNSGVWKKGVLDKIYPFVTHRDIGGAVHFYWVYDFEGRNYKYPKELVSSCIKFQRETGLIKDKPYCIDFDFTYLINRSMIQLKDNHDEKDKIDKYMYKSYAAIIDFYSDRNNFRELKNTHSIPGALASLVEVEDYFVRNGIFEKNQFGKPFDHVCWL